MGMPLLENQRLYHLLLSLQLALQDEPSFERVSVEKGARIVIAAATKPKLNKIVKAVAGGFARDIASLNSSVGGATSSAIQTRNAECHPL
jgi:hypothetical protein